MAEGRGKKDDTVEYLVDLKPKKEPSRVKISKENSAILCTVSPIREQVEARRMEKRSRYVDSVRDGLGLLMEKEGYYSKPAKVLA